MAIKLGARLRSLRIKQGLAQKELAQRLEVSPSYLNLLEHDRRPITTELLLKLGRVLDVICAPLATRTPSSAPS